MNLLTIVIVAVPAVLAVTVHEVAHGWVANRLGDPTAAQAGRLTLNPFKHVDLVGTLLVPIGLKLLGSPFLFGWAKPVPVNWRNVGTITTSYSTSARDQLNFNVVCNVARQSLPSKVQICTNGKPANAYRFNKSTHRKASSKHRDVLHIGRAVYDNVAIIMKKVPRKFT
jgi:hypothetical protein